MRPVMSEPPPLDVPGFTVTWPKIAAICQMVLAIIGGCAVVFGAIYGVYQHRDLLGFAASEIVVHPLASTPLYMLFAVENDGNKVGSVGRVTVEFQFEGDQKVFSAPLRLDVLEYEEGKTLIKPGEFQQLRVHFVDRDRLDSVIEEEKKAGIMKKAKCTFRFEIVNYDGSTAVRSLDLDCAQYFGEYLRMRNSTTIRVPPGED
jgi:hypothetical protein